MHDVKIIRAANLTMLEATIRGHLDKAEGWVVHGTPFFDANRNEWCWTLAKPGAPQPPGQIPLREPQKGVRR